MRPSQVVDLIDDVLRGVYDHIYILDLVKLRLVSKRWDLDHPNYWRNLFLRATTPGAIQFFFSRLSRSHRRPIDVHVVFPDEEDVAVAQEPEHYRPVYTVVATHMDHITSLSLCGPVHHCSDIFAVVRHAAPLLNDLSVNLQLSYSVADPQRHDITLPRDLLHDCAPLLRTIFLHNVILDAYSPPCVACVTKASVLYAQRLEVEIPHLPTWFPKATSLTMGGSQSIEVQVPNPHAHGKRLRSLRSTTTSPGGMFTRLLGAVTASDTLTGASTCWTPSINVLPDLSFLVSTSRTDIFLSRKEIVR